MEELLENIQKIRFDHTNFERRHFIPEATLAEVISEKAVKQSLGDLGVPIHEIRDLTDSILLGARKCFAILILMHQGKTISSFFRRDSLQRSFPDDRLPYTLETLQHIFDGQVTNLAIRDFLEKQWEFAIPIMHEHTVFRTLDTQVILPFLCEEPAGRGSMGTAWKIELHPQCHELPINHHKVVRKQIESRQGDDMAIFEKELKNLSLLTYLKHPNIVQLYCSYIYRQRCHLIFALADGGSLADLLNREQKTPGPQGSQLLLGLAGLADAIDSVHNFISKAFDLSLSGCHHDLAPRNILIHGDTFLLADFGLSTFRNADEDSLTNFKEVRGSYVAPECQTFASDGRIQTEKIGRASDIWSFGCILSEVLTYMILGKSGVEQFRNKRRVEVTPGLEWFRFHGGPGTPNPEVAPWLDLLQEGGEPWRVRMVHLIRMMLSTDPSMRPRSVQVLMALRGIAILSLASPVSLGLDRVNRTHRNIDLLLSNMRFRSWLFAFNQLLDMVTGIEHGKSDFDFDFIKIVNTLREMHRALEGNTGIKHQQQSLLTYHHSKLLEALPSSSRSTAEEHLIDQVLHADSEQLGGLSAAITDSGDKDIGILVAVKHLIHLADTGRLSEQPDLILDLKNITLKSDVGIHSLASFQSTSEPIVIEWLRYKASWADADVGAELRRRLTSVVGLFHAEGTAKIPGSLRCRGIFHDPSNHAFGIVYNVPPFGSTPISLHELLSRRTSRPLLEYRFRLALDICRCIYTFHKIGWLHRNLHSQNVLFFPPKGADEVKWAKDPRIVGFSSSRENLIDSFTHGPDSSNQFRNYQHPEYLTHKERYREEFDYYSIGMILLEVGLWSPLSKITDSERFKGITDEQFRTEVITTRIPQLGIAMGTVYMEITRTCLEGSFVSLPGDSGDGTDAIYMLFKELVMDRIPLTE